MLKRLIPALMLIAAPMLAHSADKPVLTVYTYDSFAAEWGPGPKVKAAFEKECGCELKFVALEDGVSVLNRVRMEGKKAAPMWCWDWTTIWCRLPRNRPVCA